MADAKAPKTPKTRSPNFPVIDLKKAMELARKLYEKAGRHAMPVNDVKSDVWDMTATSSYADQSLGAVRGFGLVEVTGKGDRRMVKISDAAAKILENHPDKAALLKAAALLPRVNKTVWERYVQDGGLPPDPTIQTYLLFEHEPAFNKASIPAFIKQLRASLSFAKVIAGDIIVDENRGEDEAEIAPGDYVQWASQGVDQFKEPLRVTEINDDGFALVDGQKTGFPVSELRRVDPPKPPADPKNPPPFTRRLPGMNQEIFALDSGTVTLQWPATMSAAEYEDFKGWLKLIENKAGRAVPKPGNPEEPKPA